jgi:hypothetical protein
LGPAATLRKRNPPSINPDHKERYILQMTGNELAGWLMTIYPLMGARRKQKIKDALSLWKEMRSNWRYSKQRETPNRIHTDFSIGHDGIS